MNHRGADAIIINTIIISSVILIISSIIIPEGAGHYCTVYSGPTPLAERCHLHTQLGAIWQKVCLKLRVLGFSWEWNKESIRYKGNTHQEFRLIYFEH